MSTFKIATWNVNSLRVRLPHVLTWLNDVKPDVLALQETKTLDADFPVDALLEAGYRATFAGQRAYNGVAVLSRLASTDAVVDFPDDADPQRRLLALTSHDVRIINIYVPNGESLISDKFTYKLNWLKNFTAFLADELKKYPALIVLGDLNIAPQAIDVHDPARWAGHVMVSESERAAFKALADVGLEDCFRLHHLTSKDYSWWDYRLNAFRRNHGLRIDHILASAPLASKCSNCQIDKAPRGWDRPSDHAPVIAEFTLS